MTWSELGRGRDFPNGQAGNLKATPGQLPLCRGHSLVGNCPFPVRSMLIIFLLIALCTIADHKLHVTESADFMGQDRSVGWRRNEPVQ
jgi:hypothetical protein